MENPGQFCVEINRFSFFAAHRRHGGMGGRFGNDDNHHLYGLTIMIVINVKKYFDPDGRRAKLAPKTNDGNG
jgi:hypothetical protein